MRMTIKLREKLVLIMVSVLLLTFCSYVYLNLKDFIQVYEDNLEERIFAQVRELEVMIKDIMELGLSLGELKGLDKECQGLVKAIPYARYCFVMDTQGKVYYHNLIEETDFTLNDIVTQNVLRSNGKLAQYYQLDSGEKIYDFSVPVKNAAGKRYAFIRLGVTSEIIDQVVSRQRNRAVVLGVIFISIAGAGVFLFTNFAILSPIRRLMKGIAEFGKGQFDSKIEIKTTDEIGELAKSFNDMVVSLDTTTVSRNELALEVKQRKQIQENLLKERDKARTYLEIVGVMIVALNRSGEVVLINLTGCKILGYSEEEIKGKNWFDNFIPQEDIDDTKEAFAKMMQGKIKEVEFFKNFVLTKDKKKKLISWHNKIIKDKSGKVVSTLSSGEDITDKQAIAERVKFLARFPSENPNPIMRINREGIILYSNEAGNSVLLDWGTSVGRSLPSEWKVFIDEIFVQNISKTKEVRHLDRIYNFEVVPMSEDKYANIYCSDVTDRIKAEERSKLFHGLVNQSNDAIYIIDSESGKFIDVNNKVLVSSGYSKDEVLALGILDLESKIPSISAWKDMIRELEKKNLKVIEGQLKRKDKRLMPVETSFKFIIHDKKRYILAVSRDITKKKITEELLAMQAQELKDALSGALKSREIMVSMLDDNNQIREQLEKNIEELKLAQNMVIQTEKLASLGKLVSDMAHEVNNPLMVISGRAQLSLMEEIDNKELAENFKIIVDQCDRAKAIIQRLLSFSKPSKGEMKEVDINRALDFVVKLVEHQFSLIDIKFTKKYAEALPMVYIDEKQMHEVFMNIVKNAAEAMTEGGSITITTSLEENNLHINFIDNGEGISEEALNDIFDPFFTTKEKGTGLGLSVCYGIIKSHQGELKYTSEVGVGTTATIILPIEGG